MLAVRRFADNGPKRKGMDMWNSFMIAFEAVVPFLIYLGLGFLVVRLGFADRPFMNQLNKFTFRVIFPFLMFNNIYSAKMEEMPSVKMLVTTAVSIVALVLILLLVVPKIIPENPKRGVIVQAVFRSNFLLYGLPLTVYVFGSGNTGITGIVLLVVISVFNIAAVIVLEMFNGEGRVNVKSLPGKMLKNPLLQGCLIGLAFFLLRIKLPDFLETPVGALGGMATPLALITLGGTLQFDAVKKNVKYLVPVLGIKLILLPILMLALGYCAIGLRGVELFLFLMVFATPVATSSYPMAVNMGGDGELAGQLVFVSTVLSLLTVFAFIFCMAQMGILYA